MKKLLIVISFLLLVGCSRQNTLKDNYEKMQIGKSIDSYQLDLRIYGTYNDKNINEIMKIDNYKNKQYKIDKIGVENEEVINQTIYVIDSKTYQLENNKYVEINEEVKMEDANLYLESLLKAKTIEKKSDKKVNDIQYKVYEITIDSSAINNILKDSILNDIKFDKDVTVNVWVDIEGYVYKVIYNLHTGLDNVDNLVIDASYFRINEIKEINVNF